jgi:hypothetical protein
MSNERLSYDKTLDYTALSDLNLLGLLCATGREWTSTISKESLALTNPPRQKENSRSTRGLVLFSVLVSLLLVGVATLTQAMGGSSKPQENVRTADVK